MVKLRAEKAVDMRDLSELGELKDWDNVQAPNTNIGQDFTAKLKSNPDIKYEFIGTELTTIADHPVAGILKKIVIFLQNEKDYLISGLSIVFFETEVQKPFKGDFEPRLFAAKDKITGSDEADILIGYGGKDKISGLGGNDAVAGKKGRDRLKGNDGDDEIAGNKGKDRIDGDDGNDTLTGGPGPDKFIFDAMLNAATNVDTITDFHVGKDKIRLDSDVFTGLGGDGSLSPKKFVVSGAAQDADDRIVHRKGKGELRHDGDGSGGDAATLFARVEPGLDLSAGDFVVFS